MREQIGLAARRTAEGGCPHIGAGSFAVVRSRGLRMLGDD